MIKIGDYIKILDKNATVTGEPVGTLLEICVLYKDHFRKEILRFETNSIINPNEKFIFDKNMIENGLIDYITKEKKKVRILTSKNKKLELELASVNLLYRLAARRPRRRDSDYQYRVVSTARAS